MGLVKDNYEIKSLGITLPKAYAIVKNISIYGTSGHATIVVQQSRELAIGKSPLEKHEIEFIVDRNENPYNTAYRAAKTNKEIGNGDEIITIEAPFNDWTDDIVER